MFSSQYTYRAYSLGTDTDTSALYDGFRSGVGAVHSGTTRLRRPLDVEAPVIPLEVHAPQDTPTDDPRTWTHIVIEQGAVMLVYRILSIAQGAQRKALGPSDAPADSWGTADFSLELDALATYYASTVTGRSYGLHVTMAGRWSRMPTPAVVEPFQIRPAQMKRVSETEIPGNLPENGTAVILNADVDVSGLIYIQINHGADASAIYVCSVTQPSLRLMALTAHNVRYPMPSLNELTGNIETYTGITASTITSINVSNRAPYLFKNGLIPGIGTVKGLYMSYTPPGGTENAVTASSYDVNGTDFARFNITHASYISASYTSDLSLLIDSTDMEVTLTDRQVRMGSVDIRDATDTVIGSIDTRYCTYDSVNETWKLQLKITTLSDAMTLTTEVMLPDGTVIKYPEGTVPFSGSAWQEYSVAQLAYDREMLAISHDRAKSNAAAGVTASLTNGAIATIANRGIGAATALVGGIGTAIELQTNIRASEAEQRAKEHLMKSTPDTVYQTGYGYSYLVAYFRNRHPRVGISMPDGVTDAEATLYAKRYGYPVTDYAASFTLGYLVTAAEGMIRGSELETLVFDDDSGDPTHGWLGADGLLRAGEIRRILEKQIKQGIHYKVIT